MASASNGSQMRSRSAPLSRANVSRMRGRTQKSILNSNNDTLKTAINDRYIKKLEEEVESSRKTLLDFLNDEELIATKDTNTTELEESFTPAEITFSRAARNVNTSKINQSKISHVHNIKKGQIKLNENEFKLLKRLIAIPEFNLFKQVKVDETINNYMKDKPSILIDIITKLVLHYLQIILSIKIAFDVIQQEHPKKNELLSRTPEMEKYRNAYLVSVFEGLYIYILESNKYIIETIMKLNYFLKSLRQSGKSAKATSEIEQAMMKATLEQIPEIIKENYTTVIPEIITNYAHFHNNIKNNLIHSVKKLIDIEKETNPAYQESLSFIASLNWLTTFRPYINSITTNEDLKKAYLAQRDIEKKAQAAKNNAKEKFSRKRAQEMQKEEEQKLKEAGEKLKELEKQLASEKKAAATAKSSTSSASGAKANSSATNVVGAAAASADNKPACASANDPECASASNSNTSSTYSGEQTATGNRILGIIGDVGHSGRSFVKGMGNLLGLRKRGASKRNTRLNTSNLSPEVQAELAASRNSALTRRTANMTNATLGLRAEAFLKKEEELKKLQEQHAASKAARREAREGGKK